MYKRNNISALCKQLLEGTGCFLVDVSVSLQNKISIAIDSNIGVTIAQCVELSRKVESQLNRDEDDYELEVSSPGLTQPFKVLEQYKKYVGKEVEVLKKDGEKLKGILKSVAENGFDLQITKTIKKENQKKKESVIADSFFEFESIKYTKLVIKF